jgi:hypothetical protein
LTVEDGTGSFTCIDRQSRAIAADTNPFPELKDVVSSNEYDSMAEEFEKKEHECSEQTVSDGRNRVGSKASGSLHSRRCR